MDRKQILAAAVLALALAALLLSGCEGITIGDPAPPAQCPPGTQPPNTECPYKLLPPVDLPPEMRQSNWGGGSCVHASLVSILRWQQLPEVADWWRANYIGGESLAGLVRKADTNGLRFAYTGDGDIGLLEWASRTRRGAVIFYYPSHSISFFGFVEHNGQRQACLMDNNRTGTYIWVPYDQFVQAWRGYGGVALTPVYTPTPPLPWI